MVCVTTPIHVVPSLQGKSGASMKIQYFMEAHKKNPGNDITKQTFLLSEVRPNTVTYENTFALYQFNDQSNIRDS
jgi:hypothetical protein